MDVLEYFKYMEKICEDNTDCEWCPAGIFVSEVDDYHCVFDNFSGVFNPEIAVKIVEQYKADEDK